MKIEKQLLLLMFCVLTATINAQNPITRSIERVYDGDDATWKTEQEWEYFYLSDGKIDYQIETYRNGGRKKWQYFYEQDSVVQIDVWEKEASARNYTFRKQENWIRDEQLRLVEFSVFPYVYSNDEDRILYKYDDNGCLWEQEDLMATYPTKWTYVKDANCRVLTKTTAYEFDFDNYYTNRFFEKYEYSTDGLEEMVVDSIFEINGAGEFEFKVVDTKIFDTEERLIYWKRKGEIEADERSWEFDEKGRILEYERNRIYVITGSTVSTIKEEFEYLEDDDGYLIEQKMLRTNSNSAGVQEEVSQFDNYCSGLPAVAHIITNGAGTFENKTVEYQYLNAEDCETVAEDNFPISVAPNPSNGWIEVGSPVFEQNLVEIALFDAAGRMIFEEKLMGLARSERLNLSFLESGVYFLKLESEGNFAVERIIVFK